MTIPHLSLVSASSASLHLYLAERRKFRHEVEPSPPVDSGAPNSWPAAVRQRLTSAADSWLAALFVLFVGIFGAPPLVRNGAGTVSYTHLTLPTILLV